MSSLTSSRPTGRPRRIVYYETGIARLDDLQARHRQLDADQAEAQAQRNEALAARKLAEAEDMAAATKALASGKRDPGSPKTEAASAKVAELTRKASLLRAAADQVADEIEAEHARRGGELADLARSRLAEQRTTVEATLEQLAGQLADLGQARAFARWCQTGPLKSEPKQAPREVTFGALQFTAEAVVTALAAAVAEPAKIERPVLAATATGGTAYLGNEIGDLDDDDGAA